MHKVTIITATTGSDYLKDNIRSVQAQTHKDVQHLLVVDGKEHLDKVKNILNKVDTNNIDLVVLPSGVCPTYACWYNNVSLEPPLSFFKFNFLCWQSA